MEKRSRATDRILVALLGSLALLCFAPPVASGQAAERYVVVDRPTSTLRSFNVSDDAPAGAVTTGVNPDAVVVSPNGRLAFVANLNSDYVSVIDLTINAEVARIGHLRARNLALNADGTRLVVPLNAPYQEEVAIVDTATLSVLERVHLNGQVGDNPAQNDILLGPVVIAGNRAYLNPQGATSSSGLVPLPVVVIDLTSYAVSTIVGSNIGQAPLDSSIAGTPDGNTVVATRIGAAQSLIINTNTGTFQAVSLGSLCAAMAVTRSSGDPDGIYAYVVCLNLGSIPLIKVMDLNPGSSAFGQLVPGANATLPFPSASSLDANSFVEIALTADSNRAYAVTANGTSVSNIAVVDTGKLLNDPANAVTSQFRVDSSLRGIAVALTQAQPPLSAPTIAGVTPGAVVNNIASTVHVTGSGFDADARVRIGNLDWVGANVLSATELEAVVPGGVPAQGGDVIVTNPKSAGPVADQQQSGMLRGQFVIASPPVFQPVHQALVTNFGESTLAILNASSNATVTPATRIGFQPQGIAVSSDGQRAYVEELRPAAVSVFSILTGQNETRIPLVGPSSTITPGQLDGIAIAPHPATGRPVAYVVAGSPAASGEDEKLFVIDVDLTDPPSSTFNTVVDTQLAGLTNGTARVGLASSPSGRFVYSWGNASPAGSNRLVVFDVLTRTTVVHTSGSLDVNPSQLRVHVTPDGQSLLLRRIDGSIKVLDISVDPMSPVPVATVTGTPPSPLTALNLIAYQVVGNRLFAYDVSRNAVVIFNFDRTTPDFSQLGSFVFPGTPAATFGGIAVTPDGNLIYAVLPGEDAVAVLDTTKVIAGDAGALLTKIRTGLGAQTIAIRPGTPTTAGTAVAVQPLQNVSLSFDSVTAGGTTTVATTNTSPFSAPAGFQLGDIPVYYEISSTAVFTGNVEICFNYGPNTINGPEADLRVAHYDTTLSPPAWVDVTVLPVNTAEHRICAQVTHLSPFVVGIGSTNFLYDSLVQVITNTIQPTGIMRSLRAKALASRAAFDRGDESAAASQLNALRLEIGAQSGNLTVVSERDYLLGQIDSILARLQ